MKEFVTALGGDVFRTLSTLILPGSVIVGPYFILLRASFPAFDALARANTAECVAGLIAVSLLVGFIVEDLGSEIESGFDWWRGKDVADEWHRYLRLAYSVEPIGHRYLKPSPSPTPAAGSGSSPGSRGGRR